MIIDEKATLVLKKRKMLLPENTIRNLSTIMSRFISKTTIFI